MNLILIAAVVALSMQADAAAPIATPSSTDVFASGRDGYAIYRIPAVETAPDGSILAFAEARKYNGGDPGQANNEIDLVMKRSEDGGRTWSPMRVIEHAGTLWSAANPATVVDRKTRRVWLLYLRCKPGRDTEAARPGTDDSQILARYSTDCGRSWSEAIDLTTASRDMKDPHWTCSVIGPGGAIQTRSGRLLAAAWKAVPYVPFSLYSDDHGRTWQRGGFVPGATGGNECQVVELSDGAVLMDIRQNGGPHRWLSRSTDGGQTWSAATPGQDVTPVACAIERWTHGSRRSGGKILWTGPRGPARSNLVIRVSTDDGRTFGEEHLIANEAAAYSDLTILKDKSVGVLWERANYRFITFTLLRRDFLEPR